MKCIQKSRMALTALLLGAMLMSAVPIRETGGGVADAPMQEVKMLTVEELVTMGPQSLGELMGHRMTLKDRIAFRIAQRELRMELRRNEIRPDARLDVHQWMADGEKGFYIGGFFLGLFLGLIGVLIAFLMKRDKAFIRSVWIGWGVWLAILVAVLVAAAGTA